MTENFKAYNNLYTLTERKELIALTIKTYREMNKKTQREVADAIGINQQTYASYERGRNEPPAEILVRLSFYYDIPLDVLMQRDNMSKDELTAKKQIELFEQGIQNLKEKLLSGDKDAVSDVQEMLNSMLKINDAMKAFTEGTNNEN